MSDVPGSLDPSHHYGGGKLSEMERKMMSVMGTSSDQEGVIGEMTADTVEIESDYVKSFLSRLPIELIDRILDHAISDDIPTSQNGFSSDSELFISSQRLSQSSKLCLVCRQFDQLSRSKMYRRINISNRKMRLFLSTIKNHEELASMIHDLTLDSKIWTDVNENVIADIFLAIRKYCVVLKVGANESPLLPYLFYGESSSEVRKDEDSHGGRSECALQVLNLCWRDEVEVQSQRNDHALESPEEKPSDTLRHLFQHSTYLQPSKEIRLPYVRLHHLTIDLYSQSQLTQLFDGKGYFVQEILPNLTFIRIELPLVALQFKCDNQGDLVTGWPRDDWTVSSRLVEEAIQDRQLHTRRTSIQALYDTDSKNDDEDLLTMPYCPSNQLKTLTLRFLLNIHRNDMTLFKLLIPQEALDKPDHSWSVRASITAQCLSATMQKHLNQHMRIKSAPDMVTFPLAEYKKKTAEVYWKQKWTAAHQDCISSLPSSVQRYHPLDFNPNKTKHFSEDTIKVSLLLKWPNAVDAFFHYSAMTTTVR